MKLMTITIIHDGMTEISVIPSCTTISQFMEAVRKFTDAPYQIKFANGAISNIITK